MYNTQICTIYLFQCFNSFVIHICNIDITLKYFNSKIFSQMTIWDNYFHITKRNQGKQRFACTYEVLITQKDVRRETLNYFYSCIMVYLGCLLVHSTIISIQKKTIRHKFLNYIILYLAKVEMKQNINYYLQVTFYVNNTF